MAIKTNHQLDMPDDAATQPWAFIGHRGSGKTYAAMKLAEELLAHGDQVVALDPVGVWYGLRLSATGKSKSAYKLPVLGGLRGDLPLEPSGGKTVADFLVDTGSSAVLDVSSLRKAQRKEFVADFAEQLFHRQKEVRRPLHLAIEEAQVFAPQRCDDGEQRMLGAIEDIVRLGRNFGFGCAMISQRPQSINKEVLNQAEPLVVFRLIAKHERDAIAGWLKHVGEDADAMIRELHKLKTGDCYLWSPSWLEWFGEYRFAKRKTYDASSTPTGDAPAPVALKPVDLKALRSAMADSIEQAEANDPKKLRARIKELERQLASQKPAVDEGAIADAVHQAYRERNAWWKSRVRGLAEGVREGLDGVSKRLAGDLGELLDPDQPTHNPTHIRRPKRQPAPQVEPATRVTTSAQNYSGASRGDGDPKLGKNHRLIVDTLAWFASIGESDPGWERVCALAAKHPRNKSMLNARGELRTGGLLADLRLTEAGHAAARPLDRALTLEDLHAQLRGRLTTLERRIFDELAAAGGRIAQSRLIELLDVHDRNKSYLNARGRLSKTFGLIRYEGRGEDRELVGTDLMYPQGLA